MYHVEKQFPQVRPLRTVEEFQRLREAAAEDAHDINSPTHYVEKDGKIIGCFNIGPVVMWWGHTKLCSVRDSIMVFTIMEAMQRNAGIQEYIMPCVNNSPLKSYMPGLGFKDYKTDFTIYKKRI